MNKVASVLLPWLAVRLADRAINKSELSIEQTKLAVAAQLQELPSAPALRITSEAFSTDAARLDRLEDKLANRRGGLELLLPFTLTLVGASLGHSNLGTVFGGLAVVLTILGYLSTRSSDDAVPRHQPVPSELLPTLTGVNPDLAQACIFWTCYQLNLPYGYRLNNRIWAAGMHLNLGISAFAIGLACYAWSH